MCRRLLCATGPMFRLFCRAAAREEGPFHRGRPDEPTGSHCQSVNAQGVDPAAFFQSSGCCEKLCNYNMFHSVPLLIPPIPSSNMKWTNFTKWSTNRSAAPQSSEYLQALNTQTHTSSHTHLTCLCPPTPDSAS